MPMATDTKCKMMLYVRERLHMGLEPDEEGFYSIKRADFIKDIPMSGSNFDRVKEEWIEYDLSEYSITCALNFKVGAPCDDHMFLDIRYEKGCLKFKRNPATLLPEMEQLWTGSVGGWDKVHSIYQYIPPISIPAGYKWPKEVSRCE